MNKYTSPKAEFVKNGSHIKDHNALIESAAFNRSIEVARQEFIRRLHSSAPKDMTGQGFASASSMAFQRMAGVEDFLNELYNLAEQPIPLPKVKDLDNLEQPTRTYPRRD